MGIQRKEVKDLLQSINDGRLAKEVAQMTSSPILTQSVLIIEGRLDWTLDGRSTLPHTNVTRAGLRNLITSIQLRSIIVQYTDSASDTAELIRGLSGYFNRSHHSLDTRPNPTSPWGRTTNKGFGVHLIQSFPGIGPELATRIYEHFNGVPLAWTVDEAALIKVPGLGKKRAAQLIASLGGDPAPVQ